MLADLVPVENLLPELAWPLLGECRRKNRARTPVSSSFFKDTDANARAMTSSNPSYLPKAPPLNTITRGMWTLTYEFYEETNT